MPELDVVWGQTHNRQVAQSLVGELGRILGEGSLYIGYPILATADDQVTVDALLVSEKTSVVAFTLCDRTPDEDDRQAWDDLRESQDRLYAAVEANLKRHDALRTGRDLAVMITTVALFPTKPKLTGDEHGSLYTDIGGLKAVIESSPVMAPGLLRPLQGALQRVTTMRRKKRREAATRPDSKGAFLKHIEQGIANLDQWQKRAAIESPEGPQRIRGLAGSGKTIVLALKAAYLHVQHPEWVIAVTFFTRSLYQQFDDLVRLFSIEHSGDTPDWDSLRLRHAWGSSSRDGMYAEIARQCGMPIRDYLYARETYGMRGAFDGVCTELLSALADAEPDPIYDAVLIDEAQDMPPSFFRLVHKFTRSPKRIVWAYDELQKLSEIAMPSLEELFGSGEDGRSVVGLSNTPGYPQQDIVLPVCYRNPPSALTLAHGLGLGTQAREGLIQHFDDPSLWTEIGYRVVDGELEQGRTVTLERRPTSYPEYFATLLTDTDAIVSRAFENQREQANWVARGISVNLQDDQLDPDDILIVLPSAYTARRDAAVIQNALEGRGIKSHLAGVTTSQDEIFSKGSVAIANIFRSKGNEAAMVYVVNAHQCVSVREQVTLRNTLFTAITRSRAWVRISGIGSGMELLLGEIESVKHLGYRLSFRIPTPDELERMRQIHRELTADERSRMRQAESGLRTFLEALERGDIELENIPLELRTAISRHLRRSDLDEDTK